MQIAWSTHRQTSARRGSRALVVTKAPRPTAERRTTPNSRHFLRSFALSSDHAVCVRYGEERRSLSLSHRFLTEETRRRLSRPVKTVSIAHLFRRAGSSATGNGHYALRRPALAHHLALNLPSLLEFYVLNPQFERGRPCAVALDSGCLTPVLVGISTCFAPRCRLRTFPPTPLRKFRL